MVTCMRSRLTELEPELSRCQAEVRQAGPPHASIIHRGGLTKVLIGVVQRDELRRRVDRLTESVREKRDLEQEAQRARRVQATLSQLDKDLLAAAAMGGKAIGGTTLPAATASVRRRRDLHR